jgi:hypothetical protein
MANIATTPEDPQHFHVFKTEKREKKLQNQSRFELWRGTGLAIRRALFSSVRIRG